MDESTWEKVILALLGGLGGFIGGLFTKLLALVVPGYNDLIKQNQDLKDENERLREKNASLWDQVEELSEKQQELEHTIRDLKNESDRKDSDKTTLGL